MDFYAFLFQLFTQLKKIAYFRPSELCKVAIFRTFPATLTVIGHFIGRHAYNTGVGMPYDSVVCSSGMRYRSLFISPLILHTLRVCMALSFQKEQGWVPGCLGKHWSIYHACTATSRKSPWSAPHGLWPQPLFVYRLDSRQGCSIARAPRDWHSVRRFVCWHKPCLMGCFASSWHYKAYW